LEYLFLTTDYSFFYFNNQMTHFFADVNRVQRGGMSVIPPGRGSPRGARGAPPNPVPNRGGLVIRGRGGSSSGSGPLPMPLPVTSPIPVSTPPSLSPSTAPTPNPLPTRPPPTSQHTEEILKVLFDYDPDNFEPGVDLRLRVGDLVQLVNQVDHQWYRGRRFDGEEGIFPINFVEKVTVKKRCRVKFEYSAQAGDELGLRLGEEINVTEENSGWFWGYNNRGETGMFPCSFVE
jgi:hypothetical protein